MQILLTSWRGNCSLVDLFLLSSCTFVCPSAQCCGFWIFSAANFYHFFISSWSRYASGSKFKRLLFMAVLWVPDILVRFGSGFADPATDLGIRLRICFLRQWLSRCQQKICFFCFPDPHPDPLVRGTDPRIRICIRIRTKTSRIHNTGSWCRNSSADITKSLRGDGSGLAFDAHNPWIDPLR